MKISEKIAQLKQREGELMRNYDMLNSLTNKSFTEVLRRIKTDELPEDELKKKETEFIKNKKKKYDEILEHIEKLEEEIIDGRNQVNKRNIELGIDKQLVEMKYIRIKLKNLMVHLKGSGYLSSSFNLGADEELGITKRIKELEQKKAKLDATIQYTNWNENFAKVTSDSP